jgi:multiple sugar transport system substrate-binding protein
MSFKEHDRSRFIVDAADAFTARRITRRELLSRLATAGIGFSAFAAGLLGSPRASRRGLAAAAAAAAETPDEVARWLKDVGGPFKGTTVRYTSEATPPTVVLNQIKGEFQDLTGIGVEIEIVPLEQVLAKATRDAEGRLGTYDLYYLDQSWVANFQPHVVDPRQNYDAKLDLAMPGFDWDDFSRPLVEQLAVYQGHWMGIPFDIPIFMLMVRKDLLERHAIAVPTTYPEFAAAAAAITQAERRNGIFGTGLQAKSGHYSLETDWTQSVWGHGGSIFRKDGTFSGNDEQGVAGLKWYQDLLPSAHPDSTASTWDGQLRMMVSGEVALVQSWDEFFPALDADGSKVKGLWEPARPLTAAALRSPGEAGFGEIPNLAHQGGSVIALSRYSRNQDAAWVFMQWACSKEIMTRCTLAGGFAPMRLSAFADPRVKAKARVGPGTTRHLDIVKWTIDNAMASEPDMKIWAGLSTNDIPTELGRLLTGQAYGGDARKCMDAVAAIVDDKVRTAGLR